MKTAIILHGMPSKESYLRVDREAQSNSHWLPWIQQQLLVNGVLAQTPELPEPYEPVYESWQSVFEKFDINEDTILIGHSCGAGFLIRWLTENKVKVGKVVLVAPWMDPHRQLKSGFYDFEIDAGISERVKSVTVFISEDDDQEMHATVQLLEKHVPKIETIRMNGKGHFTLGGMGTKEFPELKTVLLG